MLKGLYNNLLSVIGLEFGCQALRAVEGNRLVVMRYALASLKRNEVIQNDWLTSPVVNGKARRTLKCPAVHSIW